MPGSVLGNSVLRVEDPALLTGAAQYVDDLKVAGVLSAHFVRSPIAHGRIVSVDVAEALAQPGVVAVYTAEDLNLAARPDMAPVHELCVRPPLARGKVHFVGDTVAVVIAETKAQAVDAAEFVDVDYEPLPAVVDVEAALDPDSPPQIEELGSNVAHSAGGPGASVLSDAEFVARVRIENQRLAAMPMEANGVLAVPGEGDPYRLTVHPACQLPHVYWKDIAQTFGLDPSEVRITVPFVGGAFGAKAGAGAEHVVVVASALRLGRPVKWVETRSENLVAMTHGRGQVQYVEMGFTRDGAITGLRCRLIGDTGAYNGYGGMLVSTMTRIMASGVYRIPKLSYEFAVALTNTTPTGAYRGAGRPEATAYLERVMDLAAHELGMDPVELRRRNLLQPADFPYTTLTGAVYDSGDYEHALDTALEMAGYQELRTEQAARRASGDRVQLGIGVSCYVEVTALGFGEFGAVEVHPDGSATVRVGTSSHGQGHATAFSMIVTDKLGIPMDKIEFVQSDTARVPRGFGTGGSRSGQLGGTVVFNASEAVLEQARKLAAELLEAAPDDIVVTGDGRLGVAGVPESGVSWSELATAAAAKGEPLAAENDFTQPGPTFPFGAHVAVVEVDTETGRVELRRHIAVDDCGNVMNPLLVTGQQHGGVAAGVAQALWEQVRYDEDGNPLTSTLLDYAMPSAAELCSFETHNTVTPSPHNPLGVKGIGESGTIGATPAVQSAVVDALAHLGVRHIDMPCTPERVWHAIVAAESGTLPDPWREPPAYFDSLPDTTGTKPARDHAEFAL